MADHHDIEEVDVVVAAGNYSRFTPSGVSSLSLSTDSRRSAISDLRYAIGAGLRRQT